MFERAWSTPPAPAEATLNRGSRVTSAIARIAPAPAHTPSIAAMIGCGHWRIAFTASPVMRVNSISSGIDILVSGPMISCTSPPEQKLPPAPWISTTLTSSAWRRRWNRSRSSA